MTTTPVTTKPSSIASRLRSFGVVHAALSIQSAEAAKELDQRRGSALAACRALADEALADEDPGTDSGEAQAQEAPTDAAGTPPAGTPEAGRPAAGEPEADTPSAEA